MSRLSHFSRPQMSFFSKTAGCGAKQSPKIQGVSLLSTCAMGVRRTKGSILVLDPAPEPVATGDHEAPKVLAQTRQPNFELA
jgi:hypothetical protein